MRLSTSKEIRSRVDAIYREHTKAWARTHPLPELPSFSTVANEISGGKALPLIEGLKEALRWTQNEELGYKLIFECLTTPSMEHVNTLVKQRDNDLAQFLAELERAREDLLDRVLLDGDAPYPLIQAFRNWRDSKSMANEPFDGR